MPAPVLSVVLVADTLARAVLASLMALAAAIDAVEAARGGVEVVIVDASGDPAVAEALRAVEGATVLAGDPPPGGRDAALVRGAAAATAASVWVGGADAAPAPGALLALLDAAGDDAAVPAPDPGPYLVAPREVIARGTVGDGTPAGLLAALRESGVTVHEAPGAGSALVSVRRPVSGTAFGDARVDVARPGSFTAGTASYAGTGSVFKTWAATESIELGSYCSLSDDVRLLVPGGDDLFDEDGTPLTLVRRGVHRPASASTYPMGGLVPEVAYDEPPPGARGRPLVVGDDVWMGYGAVVLGGVTVGTGAIVGAGSLVLRDVPPYAVVAGNPAKVLRRRFADDVAERLQRIRWWDWPEPIVHGAARWFSRPANEFVEHFDPAGGPAAAVAA